MPVMAADIDPESETDHTQVPLLARVLTARETIRRFGPIVRPNRRLMVWSVLCLVTAAAADTGAVWMFATIIDAAVASGSVSAFWRPALVWLALAVLGGAATFAGSYLCRFAAENFVLRLRDEAFGWLHRLSPAFFARHQHGDLVARLSSDVEEVEELAASGIVQAASATATAAFFLAAAFAIRWDLALAVVAVLPLLALATQATAGRQKGLSQEGQAAEGAITAILEQDVHHLSTIQVYGGERRESLRLHQQGALWRKNRLRQSRLNAIFTPFTDLLETVAVIVVLGLGAWEISRGRLTVGGLVGFATYLGFLYAPLRTLSGLAITLSSATASSDRIAEILDATPAVADRADARGDAVRVGAVEIAELTFTYPGTTRPALRHLSFSARQGQLIVITGPSGAGKSTLAHLLARFYDPELGSIRLDGFDLRDLTLAAARRSITLLPQQAVIFEGTVASNIAYGDPGADQQQIVAAARRAGADEFVDRLPAGYATPLSSGGPELSGGQRQRIALARALVRESPVLVLDEPTAGLDAPARALLLPVLRAAGKGRTTILITHDLELAPLADQILVLRHGRLAEQGTHRQLLEHGEVYPDLLRSEWTVAPNPATSVARGSALGA